MTERDRQLVTDNYKLVYDFIWKFHLDIEEWEGILALELCRKIHLFDETKGKPSTFIMTVLKTAYFQELRNRKMMVRCANYDKTNLSLDYEYDNEDSKESCIEFFTNGDNTSNPEDTYITKTYIEFINKLEGRPADIYRDLVLNNMRQVDVAKKYNVGQSQVSRDYNKICKLMREEFNYAC